MVFIVLCFCFLGSFYTFVHFIKCFSGYIFLWNCYPQADKGQESNNYDNPLSPGGCGK